MPCCEISDCAKISKTIIAVRHFNHSKSLETAETHLFNRYYLVWVNEVDIVKGRISLQQLLRCVKDHVM